MARPNTTKYSDVEMTGETMLWATVRQARAHLEFVDCSNRAEVHVGLFTRLTKISSSELCGC